MPKHVSAVAIPPLDFSGDPAVPKHRRLYEALREAILNGLIRTGTQLPPSRTLAREMDVSRTTVLLAYDQLLAEGYIVGRVGAGTFVSDSLPEGQLGVLQHVPSPRAALSRRGTILASTPVSPLAADGRTAAFRPGLPALDVFPKATWARLAARCWRSMDGQDLGYGAAAGYIPLRQAIADHLRITRGVRCDTHQIIIVSGSQQALDLAARVLLDAGETVWVEDPGYIGARSAFIAADLVPVPVPVTAEGLDLSHALRMLPPARLVYVTPSHQYPLGVTMSLSRRLELLEWAEDQSAWILEDDYDSEYRYVGHPITALQGLDRAGRVVYVGTFSKVLFPALRLGYLVVPHALADAFASARALADRGSTLLTQMVLAEFMREGHFTRHIHHMRTLYAERQAVLVEAAKNLGGMLQVDPEDSGMHLIGWLPKGISDIAASTAARVREIDAPPLSTYSQRPQSRGGLVLGYTGVDRQGILDGVRRLGMALRDLR